MDEFEAIIERETALANFDHARDDFERTFSAVPDEALDWMPDGDEYSFATIVAHVRSSIEQYSSTLDKMREAEFEEVRMAASPDDSTTANAQPATHEEATALVQRQGSSVKNDRQGALDALDTAHDQLAAKLRELEDEEFDRAAPVVYAGATDPYPTRASDIVKWLTDHYTEHIVQYGDMLKQWGKANS